MKKKNQFFDWKTVVTTAIGGLLLLFASFVVNVFFSVPPSRAEFDSYKATTSSQYRSIDGRLKTLTTGQRKIFDHLLQERKSKDGN